MIILFSPTKTMKESTKTKPQSLPRFIKKARILNERLENMSLEELMDTLKIKENIATKVLSYIKAMRFDMKGMMAIEGFSGLMYKNLDYESLTKAQKLYLHKNLVILSGLYGILAPTDSIYNYRLDFNDKLDLYTYWGDLLARELKGEIILDISSAEFTKAVEKYLDKNLYFKVYFKEVRDRELRHIGTVSKMYRGRFARWLAVNRVEKIDEIFAYSEDGFRYNEEASKDREIVFSRESSKK